LLAAAVISGQHARPYSTARLLFALVTGVGSLFERRDFSMAATLVKHPRGDVLINTGLGRDISKQFKTLPLLFQAVTSYRLWRPAIDQLKAVGYEPKSLRGILLTHAHWDHISGLPDFPNVPVWVNSAERAFIANGGHGQFGQAFAGIATRSVGSSRVPTSDPRAVTMYMAMAQS
jgi:glyoxylase-like metal-dependent hydrolase (beta-lactamase superfamily II)